MRSAFYSNKPLKNLKYCIQRIKRGYCDADLWEIDSWFLGVIVPMLRQFAETRTGGCPVGLTNHFVPDINENMDSDKIYEIGEQKWNEAIKKLADDFEAIERIDRVLGDMKERTAFKDKCFETFSEWFFDLWD